MLQARLLRRRNPLVCAHLAKHFLPICLSSQVLHVHVLVVGLLLFHLRILNQFHITPLCQLDEICYKQVIRLSVVKRIDVMCYVLHSLALEGVLLVLFLMHIFVLMHLMLMSMLVLGKDLLLLIGNGLYDGLVDCDSSDLVRFQQLVMLLEFHHSRTNVRFLQRYLLRF